MVGSISAPSSKLIVGAIGVRLIDGTLTYSAYAPGTRAPIAFSFGCCDGIPAGCSEPLSGTIAGLPATRSPTFTLVTSEPTSTTSPENSWPHGSPGMYGPSLR